MTDASELPQVYLQLGEVHFARSPSILRTVLGSCVGVTLWSPRLRIGALCHGVLPRCPRGTRAPEGYRYVDFAIRDLARQFEGSGVGRTEVQVKVFGGADVLPIHPSRSGKATVGRQNSETALRTLEEEGLVVVASDLGGPVGRTVEFNTANGEVLLRRLSKQTRFPGEY